MTSKPEIIIEPLEATQFAPFGNVIEIKGKPDALINEGRCGRFHDLAHLDFIGEGAKAGISLFQSALCTLPYRCKLFERHPMGSQAFIPMSFDPFLVITAEDEGGFPVRPRAFLTNPGQGVNYHRNVWHGVLTPLSGPGLFAVIDRIGGGDNLEEVRLKEGFLIKN